MTVDVPEPTAADGARVVAAVRAALGAPAPDPADYDYAASVVRDELWVWFARGRESHYRGTTAPSAVTVEANGPPTPAAS